MWTIIGNVHSNQTGAFPILSISGNKYIFLLYDDDTDYIEAVAIPSHTQHKNLKDYQQYNDMHKSRGVETQLQRLDNEAYKLLKDYMYKEK